MSDQREHAQAPQAEANRWLSSKKAKMTLFALVLIGGVSAIGLRLYTSIQNRLSLETHYSTITQGLIQYSLLSYISKEDQEIVVTQMNNLGYGGGPFTIECNPSEYTFGGVFSCIDRAAKRSCERIAEVSEQDFYDQPITTSNAPGFYNGGEIQHTFSVYTIFGKRVDVTLNQRSSIADSLLDDQKDLLNSETNDSGTGCATGLYAVRATYTRPDNQPELIEFAIETGSFTTNPSGDLVLDPRWYVTSVSNSEGEPNAMTTHDVRELTDKVRRDLERAGFFGADLTSIGPTIEAKWQNRDADFFAELAGIVEDAGKVGK